MSLSCSGEQTEYFENPFEVLAQLEFEISLKIHAQSNFSGKIEKKHKSLGRDLKNQFLPNKKHFSLVHDGIRNFLGCGPEDLFLTSPLSLDGTRTASKTQLKLMSGHNGRHLSS